MAPIPGWYRIFSRRRCQSRPRHGINTATPTSRREWAELMEALSVKVVHIAERDTQVTDKPKVVGEFVNTWSIEGFVGEGCQPSELGWGSHREEPAARRQPAWFRLRRRHLPESAGRQYPGPDVDPEGGAVPWLPDHPRRSHLHRRLFYGRRGGGEVRFRPTVHYAYHPCDDAVLSIHELAGKNWPSSRRSVC